MCYEKKYVENYEKVGTNEQLVQLLQIVEDGDLISKSMRDILVSHGYACRYKGFNIITKSGLKVLVDTGIVKM